MKCSVNCSRDFTLHVCQPGCRSPSFQGLWQLSVMVVNRNQKPLIELTTRHAGSTGHSGQLCFYHKHTQEVCQRWPQTSWLLDLPAPVPLCLKSSAAALYFLCFCFCVDHKKHHSSVSNPGDDWPLLQLPHQWETGHLGQSFSVPLVSGESLMVSLLLSVWPSHLRRPLDASSTCCVLSSTHSRMGPNCRLSTENIPFQRTTSNTQCTTASYVCSVFLWTSAVV